MLHCGLKCHQCGNEWDTTRDILKYEDKYFCDDQCLGEYLVEKVDGDIEVVFYETEENRRTRILEDRYDEFR